MNKTNKYIDNIRFDKSIDYVANNYDFIRPDFDNICKCNNIIVLHSGGIDSTSSILSLADNFPHDNILSLGYQYNQPDKDELIFADKICAKEAIERKTSDLTCLEEIMNITKKLSNKDMNNEAEVYNRNIIYAMNNDYVVLCIGKGDEDYPGANPAMISKINEVIKMTNSKLCEAYTPLTEVTKWIVS
ncbi:MAG: 7-cyano-7-deazaguanine synthase [Methanobrevibacter sp.]|jgi:7-cyano-7-deazaguanine synthase in queuosine biosynthesis|nr:7-cyano-7-deazaguanine synthase [Candidatus Methanovirga basalitermitum]